MEATEQTRKLRDQSVHYLENASAYLKAREAEKASEFLWGSMAQALKAVASRKGASLRSHRQLGHYARELAKDLSDDELHVAFVGAQALHRNFYELGTELEDVAVLAEKVSKAVEKLLALLPV